MVTVGDTSPGARSRALPHLRPLDGLRGVAVAVVLLFHADVPGVSGGHLGVSVFFTLSGFLITALLLSERHRQGSVDLGRFWARRARRLVPAIVLSFFLIAVVLKMSPAEPADGVLGDGIAAATWVANWRFILDGATYADLFSMPSPFQHFWSLAVEEQFYVFFPLLFILVVGRRTSTPRTRRLMVVLAVLALASTLQAAHLTFGGEGFSRAYYGTDARAAELLVGALLATLLIRPDGLVALRGRPQLAVQLGGVVGVVGLVAAFAVAHKSDLAVYRGGLLVVALLSAAVIAAATQGGSPVGRLLSTAPLVRLGVISYGVYLYHWPVFLLLDEEFTGAGPVVLLGLRLGVTLGLAWVSYVAFEHPIRYGTLPLAHGLGGWAVGATAGVVAVGMAAGQITVPVPRPAPLPAQALVGGPEVLTPITGTESPTAGPKPSAAAPPVSSTSPLTVAPPSPATRPRTQVVPPAPPPRVRERSSQRPKAQSSVPKALVQNPQHTPVPPQPEHTPGMLRVAVVGDSVAGNLGQGLRIMATERDDIAVYNLAVPACPMSLGRDRRLGPETRFDVDPVCEWWADPESDRRKALEEWDPDVIVVQDAVNEALDRRLPEWEDWRRPGQRQFDDWLSAQYQTMIEMWAAAGAKIVMTNAACNDWDRYDAFAEVEDPERRVFDLNFGVYGQMSGVTRADFFQRVCPGGQYSDDVEGVEDGRYDGFHFTADASAALARNWLGPIVFQAAEAGSSPLG